MLIRHLLHFVCRHGLNIFLSFVGIGWRHQIMNDEIIRRENMIYLGFFNARYCTNVERHKWRERELNLSWSMLLINWFLFKNVHQEPIVSRTIMKKTVKNVKKDFTADSVLTSVNVQGEVFSIYLNYEKNTISNCNV